MQHICVLIVTGAIASLSSILILGLPVDAQTSPTAAEKRDGPSSAKTADPAKIADQLRHCNVEHLLSWLDPWLAKLAEIAPPAYAAWGELLASALRAEAAATLARRRAAAPRHCGRSRRSSRRSAPAGRRSSTACSRPPAAGSYSPAPTSRAPRASSGSAVAWPSAATPCATCSARTRLGRWAGSRGGGARRAPPGGGGRTGHRRALERTRRRHGGGARRRACRGDRSGGDARRIRPRARRSGRRSWARSSGTRTRSNYSTTVWLCCRRVWVVHPQPLE